MKKSFSCVFPISVLALAANAAWAIDVTLQTDAVTGEKYVSMPVAGGYDVSITADDIANGLTSFKIYDNENKTSSVNESDLWVKIPIGYKFQVMGHVNIPDGYFRIMDGTVQSVDKKVNDGDYNIGTNTVYGYLGFRYRSNSRNDEKFDITVSILKSPIDFEYPEYDAGNLYAFIDGNYQGTDAIDIPNTIHTVPVDKVVFNRKFSTSGYSTLMLPFDYVATDFENVEAIIEFAEMTTNDKGELAVGMKYVWCTSEVEKSLKAEAEAKGKGDDYDHCSEFTGAMTAYTPYMVLMGDAELVFKEGATLAASAGAKNAVSHDGWTFKAALQKTVFTKDDTKDGKIWGFAGEERDGATIGKFVRFGKGAYVQPFRAYLESSSPQLVSASPNAQFAARPSVGSETASIESIDVVIVSRGNDGEKHTTTIGKFNTRTGEFQMLRNYDLKGRKTNITNRAQGAYYGKKVLKK